MMPPPMMTTRAWVGKFGRPCQSDGPAHGGLVHLAHLRHAGLHRIAAGRRIDGGHLGELVEMAFLDAELGQGMRDADLAAEVEAPLHEAVEGRVAQAEPARQPLDLLVDGGAVELQHIGHGDGVGEAVVGVEHGAHRMRQRMDGAQALLEGGRAHLRGGQHVAPRLDVAAVLDGAREVLLHQPHALDGDAFGIGVIARRAIGLEAMDEGVHAGAGRELGRQADRQLGIGDDDRRASSWDGRSPSWCASPRW